MKIASISFRCQGDQKTSQQSDKNNAKHITNNWMAKLARIRVPTLIGILLYNTKRNSPAADVKQGEKIIVRGKL